VQHNFQNRALAATLEAMVFEEICRAAIDTGIALHGMRPEGG
jgi:hypothetical protein